MMCVRITMLQSCILWPKFNCELEWAREWSLYALRIIRDMTIHKLHVSHLLTTAFSHRYRVAWMYDMLPKFDNNGHFEQCFMMLGAAVLFAMQGAKRVGVRRSRVYCKCCVMVLWSIPIYLKIACPRWGFNASLSVRFKPDANCAYCIGYILPYNVFIRSAGFLCWRAPFKGRLEWNHGDASPEERRQQHNPCRHCSMPKGERGLLQWYLRSEANNSIDTVHTKLHNKFSFLLFTSMLYWCSLACPLSSYWYHLTLQVGPEVWLQIVGSIYGFS